MKHSNRFEWCFGSLWNLQTEIFDLVEVDALQSMLLLHPAPLTSQHHIFELGLHITEYVDCLLVGQPVSYVQLDDLTWLNLRSPSPLPLRVKAIRYSGSLSASESNG